MTEPKNNGYFTFLENGDVLLSEETGNQTREPWLMLMARRNQNPAETLCFGLTNNGSSFARIGTQEGDLINGFVHEDPYKTRLLGPYTYIVDENGEYFTNTWYPLERKDQELKTLFSFGSLSSETSCLGLSVKTENFIPNSYNATFQLITVKNNTKKTRNIRMYHINPINIGDARDIQFSGFNTLMMGGGVYEPSIESLVWRSHFGVPFSDNTDEIKGMFGKVLIHTTSEGCSQYSTKYEDFIGHYSRTMANPEGLTKEILACRPAEELTSALSTIMNFYELKPGEERTVVVALIASSTQDYYCDNKKELKEILGIVKNPPLVRALLEDVKASWKKDLDQLKINVPGEDTLMHSFKWLQYQCSMVASLNRMKSRYHSGFEYGYGFRDILQDLLAVLPSDTLSVKNNLKYVAEQMFSDGSVYHNFFVSAKGNKDFNACDDPLWFVYAVCEYVKETGDFDFLSEEIPYADSKEELPSAHGSIYQHCKTAVDKVWKYSREGLPFMFDADWNDDLSGYDEHLSVMAAEMLFKAFNDLAELNEFQHLFTQDSEVYRSHAKIVRVSINNLCIDKEGRYKRIVSTDKNRMLDLGSCDTDGLTFFEPVAWAGYSGIATKEQFVKASQIAEKDLLDRVGFTICHADTRLQDGFLPHDEAAWKRNAPGKKENGGAFRHLESWYIASLCSFGFGEKAWDLFYKTLPAVCSKEDPYIYGAERFVFPEYVSGPDSNEHGRAGHTWLTGTAPTRQRVLIESIFGLKSSYVGLIIDPCVSPLWKEFSAYRRFRNSGFSIEYRNPEGIEKGVKSMTVDGFTIEGNTIPERFYDGQEHRVSVVMGL